MGDLDRVPCQCHRVKDPLLLNRHCIYDCLEIRRELIQQLFQIFPDIPVKPLFDQAVKGFHEAGVASGK